MENWRRYEVLLPWRFNTGRPVPKALLAKTVQELERRFSAVSCETQIIQGQWRNKGVVFRDDLIRIYVDVQRTAEVERFFVQFKARLKQRFRQLDIWITSHVIDVI